MVLTSQHGALLRTKLGRPHRSDTRGEAEAKSEGLSPSDAGLASILWSLLAYAGVSLSTLSWVPLLSGGGTILELSNVTQLVFILLLPAILLFSRPAPMIHLVFSLLVAWSLVMLLALTLHGESGGTGFVRQQFPQALFGWSLALCIANSRAKVSRMGLVGLIALFAALEFSAITAGASAFIGALEFVTSLDRTTFIFRVLRPALNAFIHQEGDPVYVASQINNVANTIVLLACLAFFSGVEQPRGPGRLLGNMVAGAALIFAFIMFSSSAVLTMALFGVATMLQVTLRLPSHLRNLAILFILTVVIVLYQPVNTFLEVNLSEDEVSRSVRVEQFKYAMSAINSNVLTGVGYFEVGGHVIHNWMLFSWATAGLSAFLIVLAVYASLMLMALLLARSAPRGTPTVIALLVMFLIRTSVGGAGGIPSGPAILAAALLLGLLVRYYRPPVRRPQVLRLARGLA